MTRGMEQLEQCRQALAANGFDAWVAGDPAAAKRIFFAEIWSDLKHGLITWGDSLTMEATGVLEALLADPAVNLLKTFDPEATSREIVERRRQALLADLYLTGSNAVTLDGKLANLDMIGNRTAAIAFGPKKVVIFAGRNKLVPDLPAAMDRVRNHAAPINAKRHNMATPCVKTGRCHDCRSPQRICNTWSIMEKCYPPGRIKVVLIDADLGL